MMRGWLTIWNLLEQNSGDQGSPAVRLVTHQLTLPPVDWWELQQSGVILTRERYKAQWWCWCWEGGGARNYTLGSWESDRLAGNQVTHILVFSIFSSDSSISWCKFKENPSIIIWNIDSPEDGFVVVLIYKAQTWVCFLVLKCRIRNSWIPWGT